MARPFVGSGGDANICSYRADSYWMKNEGRGYYRCRRCRSEQVARRRRQLKATLVAEACGACRLCGDDRCSSALEFHHLDRATKRLGISAGGLSLATDVLRQETSKCILLCSNCHAEVESGVRQLEVSQARSGQPFA